MELFSTTLVISDSWKALLEILHSRKDLSRSGTFLSGNICSISFGHTCIESPNLISFNGTSFRVNLKL